MKSSNKYLKLRRPWLADEAVDVLHTLVKPDWRVFEWGSGGSTLFFLDRLAHVVSVEHHEPWAHKVVEYAQANENHVRLMMQAIPANGNAPAGHDPSNYLKCSSTDGKDYTRYVGYMAVYPLEPTFDLVLVDGRARPACVWMAVHRVKPGGFIVLDDSQRVHYQAVQHMLRQFKWDAKYVFPLHGDPGFGRRVTFWQKPQTNER